MIAHNLYQIGSRLRNPSLARWYQFLKKSENWSREQLLDYQLQQLQNCLIGPLKVLPSTRNTLRRLALTRKRSDHWMIYNTARSLPSRIYSHTIRRSIAQEIAANASLQKPQDQPVKRWFFKEMNHGIPSTVLVCVVACRGMEWTLGTGMDISGVTTSIPPTS